MFWKKINDENYIGRGYLNYNLVKVMCGDDFWVADVDCLTHEMFFAKGSFEECKETCELDNDDWLGQIVRKEL